jgi:hypothetical protein
VREGVFVQNVTVHIAGEMPQSLKAAVEQILGRPIISPIGAFSMTRDFKQSSEPPQPLTGNSPR